MYDLTTGQLSTTLSSQVSPSVLANVLAALHGVSPVVVDAAGASHNIDITTSTGLVVTNDPSENAYLGSLTPDANGAVSPSADSATLLNNSSGSNTVVVAESAAFYEVQTGPFSLIGGSGPFIVDASHDSSPVSETAGTGYSFLIGGSGQDTLTGSQSPTGKAVLVAGSGPTTVQGGQGQDTLFGGGKSNLIGGSGSGQQLFGGYSPTAADTLTAGSGGKEILAVGQGNNFLDDRPSGGGDTLFSGVGHDKIDTGAAGAVIAISTGMTTVAGGTGADQIYVSKGGAGSTESIDGGSSGTSFVQFNGYKSTDATQVTTAGVTTITFTATGQTATVTHATILFGNDTTSP